MTRKTDELVMQLIGNEYSLRTLLWPTEGLPREIQPVFSAYVVHT